MGTQGPPTAIIPAEILSVLSCEAGGLEDRHAGKIQHVTHGRIIYLINKLPGLGDVLFGFLGERLFRNADMGEKMR